ncbi:DUF2961 domain-containing protein [Candidatus Hydrogenedentota bacterium]
MLDYNKIAAIRNNRFGMCNGGWNRDAYPELEPLDAGKSITIAEISGPAVITFIHITQHHIREHRRRDGMTDEECNRICARGIILEIYYNDVRVPAVRAPLADFFADGCCGLAEDFSSLYVEKAPGSYNSSIPMPFEGSARVVLRNETEFDINNYSYVEFEKIPSWDGDLGYFHATWKRFAFQLHAETDQHFFHADGRGHLIGRAWSICTDEPFFSGYHFVMEGNNEVRIDGEEDPRADYLGTECSFGFCWGFPRVFTGLKHGINFVQGEGPSLLSVYRFRDTNAIGFDTSIDWRIDWTNEWKNNAGFQEKIAAIRDSGGVWIDYATTFYWYQDRVGYEHEDLAPFEERIRTILRSRDPT